MAHRVHVPRHLLGDAMVHHLHAVPDNIFKHVGKNNLLGGSRRGGARGQGPPPTQCYRDTTSPYVFTANYKYYSLLIGIRRRL
jgi:hypothetical protein